MQIPTRSRFSLFTERASLALQTRMDSVITGGWSRAVARFDNLQNAMTGLGGTKDKGAAARPYLRPRLTMPELESLHRDSGLARRIVGLHPDHATRRGWQVLDDSDEADRFKAQEKALSLPRTIKQGLRWGRTFGGAVALKIVEEERAPLSLSEPLRPENVRQVHRLLLLDRREAIPVEWGRDPFAPDFRGVLYWDIAPVRADGILRRVHHSRIIFFPGHPAPPSRTAELGGWEESVLQVCWDQLRNKASIEQSAAVIAQELRLHIIKSGMLGGRQMADTGGDFAERMKYLAQSRGMLSTILLGPDEEYHTSDAKVTGWDKLDERSMVALSAVTGIPIPLISGQAPGGLNSDGESWWKAWTGDVSAYQQEVVLPILEDVYGLLYAAKEGPTGGTIPKGWSVSFNPLDEPSEKEEAEVRKLRAEADKVYVDIGVLDPGHVTKSRFGEDGYQSEILPISDADIAAAEAQAEALAEATRERLKAQEEAGGPEPVEEEEEGPGEEPEERDDSCACMWGVRLDDVRRDGRIIIHTDTRAPANVVANNALRDGRLTRPGKCQKCGAKGAPQMHHEDYGKPLNVDWLCRSCHEARHKALRKAGKDPKNSQRGQQQGRGDAEDAVWLHLPVGGTALEAWKRNRDNAAHFLPGIELTADPHVTLLYLGPAGADALADIEARVRDLLAEERIPEPQTTGIGWFHPDEPEARTPIVLGVRRGNLQGLHRRLLRALAHHVQAPLHDEYRPHITLGYLPRPMTAEEETALIGLAMMTQEWHPGRVIIRRGSEVIAEVPLHPRMDDGEPAGPSADDAAGEGEE